MLVSTLAFELGGCQAGVEPEARPDAAVGDAEPAQASGETDASPAPEAPADAERAAPRPDAAVSAAEPPTAAIDAPDRRRAVHDVVYLRPTKTHDGATYTWRIIERPAGSTTRPVEALGGDPQSPLTEALEDDPETPTAVLFLDQVGAYTVTLLVVAADGAQAEANATFESTTGSAIHIELSWDTPGDANQIDGAGTDVDMHFTRPGGTWNTSSDCHHAHPAPDWGAVDDARDDPALDLDDVDGAGPENIHLDAPEDTENLGGPYQVGVDYFREEDLGTLEGYGSSFVTVRVYLDGALAWMNEAPRELAHAQAFWHVGEIIWTPMDHRFQALDRVYDQVPRVP
jgi:hypothetical protein